MNKIAIYQGDIIRATAVITDALARIRQKLEDQFVTELCPHCSAENTIAWDVQRQGYQAYCPACGGSLMLCSKCPDSLGLCDFNNTTGRCSKMKEVTQ